MKMHFPHQIINPHNLKDYGNFPLQFDIEFNLSNTYTQFVVSFHTYVEGI